MVCYSHWVQLHLTGNRNALPWSIVSIEEWLPFDQGVECYIDFSNGRQCTWPDRVARQNPGCAPITQHLKRGSLIPRWPMQREGLSATPKPKKSDLSPTARVTGRPPPSTTPWHCQSQIHGDVDYGLWWLLHRPYYTSAHTSLRHGSGVSRSNGFLIF